MSCLIWHRMQLDNLELPFGGLVVEQTLVLYRKVTIYVVMKNNYIAFLPEFREEDDVGYNIKYGYDSFLWSQQC